MSFNIIPKCAPDKKLLSLVADAGFAGVELYTNRHIIAAGDRVIKLCRNFKLRYAVHGPNDDCRVEDLVNFIRKFRPEVLILHNLYWDDEWEYLYKKTKGLPTKVCLENTFSITEPVRFMRRYGFRMCTDLEHLQVEAAGLFGEVFLDILKQAGHVHITGYRYGKTEWHTPAYFNPGHTLKLFRLIKNSGYSGLLVSEAGVKYQTKEGFEQLKRFSEKINNSL